MLEDEVRGPFLGGQLDLITISNEEYITFSVPFIPPGEVTIKRIGLATRAFPGQHTATDVIFWVEKVRCCPVSYCRSCVSYCLLYFYFCLRLVHTE